MISLVVWLPLVVALIVMIVPEEMARIARGLAIVGGLGTLALSLLMFGEFHPGFAGFQLVENRVWLPTLGIGYRVGVDGISIWMAPLAALISLVALAFSYKITSRVRLYLALVLLLETAMIGAFVSLDLILFYTFFELTLVPMAFLISIWGGERRRFAAAKFFIYTFAGSVFMLVGMVAMAYLGSRATGVWTFDIVELQSKIASGALWAGALQAEAVIFWTFAIAFLIKAPAFPFHTWVPDTYAEAPIAGPIMSSVMVKMGTYGLLRFCLPLFPDVAGKYLPVLLALAVVGILYGAILAAVQTDIRRLLAYSSVSHMGFILLGILSFSQIGMVGGAYQQISHAITSTALFALVAFLVERRGSANLADFGGLKAKVPLLATLFLISMLASVGLPGLNGFVGEFLAIIGSFQSAYLGLLGYGIPVLAGLGVVLSAAYLLYLFQQIFYGKGDDKPIVDLKLWEAAVVGSLIVLMVWGGLYPSTFTRPTEASLALAKEMSLSPIGARPTWEAGPKSNEPGEEGDSGR